jgi:lipopolysaccharide export system protein LptA
MAMRAALSLLLASGLAVAQAPVPIAPPQPATPAATRDPLRPTGPVTVTADRAEWQESGLTRYTGNVTLTSDTLTLSGQSLELRQFEDGRYEARIAGAPARLTHPAPVSAREAQPPISAAARNLHYDSASGLVDVIGDARMARGGDEITGEKIRYNVRQRRIEASGGNGSQVRIIIQPPAGGGSPNRKKP